jgi:hypothetical protein
MIDLLTMSLAKRLAVAVCICALLWLAALWALN